ncbi:MAG: AI-2E family transporter [Methylotenera sp.]|nr:AI-2E family transporter [Oligoflexia bacterium]
MISTPEPSLEKSRFGLLQFLFLTYVIGFIFYHAGPLCLLVVTSFFLFALMDPWVAYFKRRNLHPALPSLIGAIIAILILAAFTGLFYSVASNLLKQVQSYQAVILNHLKELQNHFQFLMIDPTTPTEKVQGASEVTNAASDSAASHSVLSAISFSHMVSGAGSVLSFLTMSLLIPLLTWFMILEKKTLSLFFSSLYGSEDQTRKVWKEITRLSQAFFVGNLILAVISSAIFLVLFLAFKLHGAFSLAIVSGVLNEIPFVGSILCAVFPALQALSQGLGAGVALSLLLLSIVIHFTVANVVTPKLLGSRVNLNATYSTIALIGWGYLWGTLGLIFAIPLTGLLKILFEYSSIPTLQALALSMSSDPEALANTRLDQMVGLDRLLRNQRPSKKPST